MSQPYGVIARLLVTSVACVASACASASKPDLVNRDYPPPVLTERGTEIGLSSWYGPGFEGKSTASGEPYDADAMTAAHRTLPLGTEVEVTDRATHRSIVVRINDRGPYVTDRVLDLSYAAARALGVVERGVAEVELRPRGKSRAVWSEVRYCVQIGVYRERGRADASLTRVRKAGLPAFLDASLSSHPVYRVRVGPYPDRNQAYRVSRKLEQRGFSTLIVELGPSPDTTREARPSKKGS